ADTDTHYAPSDDPVTFTFCADALSTCSYAAVLSSGDLSASMVFTVLNDNEDPGDAEGEDPDDTDGKDPDDTDGKDPDDTDGKDPDDTDGNDPDDTDAKDPDDTDGQPAIGTVA